MAGRDRISGLPDDVLRRVLHFAPSKEAASTSALSRRWRSLWRSSGAVNLEVRLREDVDCTDYRAPREAFVSAARAALEAAAAGGPVTRLTFLAEADDDYYYAIRQFLHSGNINWPKDDDIDVVAGVLSHPAALRVEELRLAAVDCIRCVHSQEEASSYTATVVGALSLGSLPSETLRVLDLTNFISLTPAPGVASFPRLATLRLRLCAVSLEDLQGVIDAAPELATVHLESVLLSGEYTVRHRVLYIDTSVLRLRCPAATALVLENCGWPQELQVEHELEIDAPRLRRFRYKGLLRQLSLSPRPPDLARADLHFIPDDAYHGYNVIFWRFVRNFSDAKELKLRVNHLEDIAVVGEAMRAELLCAFRNLERLELEGVHRPKGKTAAVAIANLLRCCPVVRDLRIKLSTAQSDSCNKRALYARAFLQQKFRRDLDRSMDRFKHRRSEPMIVSVEGGGDDDAKYDEVSDIPGLSGRPFSCLQSSLRCVGLQFRQEKSNCFGVKLIKFFAENAMVLEEMRIDGGNVKMCEHMNRKVEEWIANSSKGRPGTKGFRVLPLER